MTFFKLPIFWKPLVNFQSRSYLCHFVFYGTITYHLWNCSRWNFLQVDLYWNSKLIYIETANWSILKLHKGSMWVFLYYAVFRKGWINYINFSRMQHCDSELVRDILPQYRRVISRGIPGLNAKVHICGYTLDPLWIHCRKKLYRWQSSLSWFRLFLFAISVHIFFESKKKKKKINKKTLENFKTICAGCHKVMWNIIIFHN